MDTEEICIISTPQPRCRRLPCSSVVPATACIQQQSGRKRRAPHRRLQLQQDSKASFAYSDDEEVPAAKRFKQSTIAATVLVFDSSTTTPKQHQITTTCATINRHHCATTATTATAPREPSTELPMLTMTPRQSYRTLTPETEDHKARGKRRSLRARTPENHHQEHLMIRLPDDESPRPIFRSRYTKQKHGESDGGYKHKDPLSPSGLLSSPIHRSHRITTPSPGALKMNSNHGGSKLEQEKLFEVSLSSLSYDPYQTPRGPSSHRSKQSLSDTLLHRHDGAVTPTRATVKTPERSSGSSKLLDRRASPVTPHAPLRARQRGRMSQALISGNKQQLEAALMSGEDPNEEISVPVPVGEMESRMLPNNMQRQNMLPLLAAAKLNASASIIENLIEHGAVPNSVNSLGQTALHIVCQQTLNRRRSTLSQTSSNCSSFPSTPIPQSWLKLQAFFETLSPELSPQLPNDSAMHHTSGKRKKESLKPVDQRNKVNDRDAESDDERLGTPRWLRGLASVHKETEQLNNDQSDSIKESEIVSTVRLLLKCGTDPTKKDTHGRTAASYAKDKGLLSVYGILCDATNDEQHQESSLGLNHQESSSGLNQKKVKETSHHSQSSDFFDHGGTLIDAKSSTTCVSLHHQTLSTQSTKLIPAKHQTTILSFFPTVVSPRHLSHGKNSNSRNGANSRKPPHRPRLVYSTELQPFTRKNVKPPPDKAKNPPPVVLLSLLPTQTRPSYHEPTGEQQRLQHSGSTSSDKHRIRSIKS